jgi:uncharacterized membrane protein YbhN (UPF0104 family)
MLPVQLAAGIGRDIIAGQLALFAALLAAIGILLFVPRILPLLRHAFINKLSRVLDGYSLLVQRRRSTIQLVIALLNLLSAWGALYLLFRAAGLTLPAWLIAGLIPLLQLVNSLPFLYMGWGGRELVMVATLGSASDLTVNDTLAVSIAWGMVLIMTGAINGLFLLGNWRTGPQAPPIGDRTSEIDVGNRE